MISLQGVWIFHLIDLNDLTYDNGSYHFPPWTAATGWCVLALLLGLVPALAVLAVYQAEGKTFLKVGPLLFTVFFSPRFLFVNSKVGRPIAIGD